MGRHSVYFGMDNGYMMEAMGTTAVITVMGVMNLTMGCADGGLNTGVGRVLILIRVMVTVRRHSASDG